jgi:phosphatidylserine/phosphatidylglycerophosphate/cardiolipin synthase-like enzyme
MGRIIAAHAWANNEVAYVAWDTDGRIEGCLGFEVTRVYVRVDAAGNVLPEDGSEERVKCAAWVAFKGQRNPNWLAQDTGVWPVQKFSWRDLTLRKRRVGATRRPDEVRVRYEIRPVGDLAPGRPAVPSNGLEKQSFVKRDSFGKPIVGPDGKWLRVEGPAYQGEPRPLGYLDEAASSNVVLVTSRRPPFRTTFNNGVLSAQWLRNVLMEDGVIGKNELIDKLEDPEDPHRRYLAGDVLPLIHELLAREGTFHLALYELEDRELEDLLVASKDRIHVILANSAASGGKWDARNAPARKRLHDSGVDVQDRMFNNSKHIGHNKFVVHVDPQGTPQAVLTGSTNWTSTGVAGQTNNAILIEDPAVAEAYLAYWKHLHDDDVQETPRPLSATMPDAQQGPLLREVDETPARVTIGSATLDVWFSPNRPERTKPTSKKHPAPTPPDLQDVYNRIRMAKEAILFLAFYPAQRGVDCIIGEAIDIGRKDRSLIVMGAVSSPQAMPNYVPKEKDDEGDVVDEGASPATFDEENISLVRAAHLDDSTLLGDFNVEPWRIGAIIHDKILVIDPRSPTDCSVTFGSHNLGFKASYSNDENLVVVAGHQELAMAYAVHVLDVYDHYRFRAIQTDQHRQGKKGWGGFLDVDDRWQDDYVVRRKGAVSRYFAR